MFFRLVLKHPVSGQSNGNILSNLECSAEYMLVPFVKVIERASKDDLVVEPLAVSQELHTP